MEKENKMNGLSKEAEARIHDFFNTKIDPHVMAKSIRQLNYIIALGILREHETLQRQIENLENSFYWLNEFAEVLHPYLEIESVSKR